MKDYLIIDRSKWRSGDWSFNTTGEGGTYLLNKQGYMCCLGFRCHQMGIPKEDLLDRGGPWELSFKWNIPDLLDEDVSYKNSDFTDEAIDINDDVLLTPAEREIAIKNHFKKIGVIVEFTGKYK
jgi:hypothetical protein